MSRLLSFAFVSLTVALLPQSAWCSKKKGPNKTQLGIIGASIKWKRPANQDEVKKLAGTLVNDPGFYKGQDKQKVFLETVHAINQILEETKFSDFSDTVVALNREGAFDEPDNRSLPSNPPHPATPPSESNEIEVEKCVPTESAPETSLRDNVQIAQLILSLFESEKKPEEEKSAPESSPFRGVELKNQADSGNAEALQEYVLYELNELRKGKVPRESLRKYFVEMKTYFKKALDLPTLPEGAKPGIKNFLATAYYYSVKDKSKPRERHAISPDLQEAKNLFTEISSTLSARGLARLGRLWTTPEAGPVDYGKARAYYKDAYKAGDLDVLVPLGELYEKGEGGDRDFAKARVSYERALRSESQQVQESARVGLLRLDALEKEESEKKARDIQHRTKIAAEKAALIHVVAPAPVVAPTPTPVVGPAPTSVVVPAASKEKFYPPVEFTSSSKQADSTKRRRDEPPSVLARTEKDSKYRTLEVSRPSAPPPVAAPPAPREIKSSASSKRSSDSYFHEKERKEKEKKREKEHKKDRDSKKSKSGSDKDRKKHSENKTTFSYQFNKWMEKNGFKDVFALEKKMIELKKTCPSMGQILFEWIDESDGLRSDNSIYLEILGLKWENSKLIDEKGYFKKR